MQTDKCSVDFLLDTVQTSVGPLAKFLHWVQSAEWEK